MAKYIISEKFCLNFKHINKMKQNSGVMMELKLFKEIVKNIQTTNDIADHACNVISLFYQKITKKRVNIRNTVKNFKNLKWQK